MIMGEKSMKIDFHVHAALSKEIGFDLSLFHRTLERARKSGLEALTLTDHLDSSNYDRIHRALDREFDYVGPHYVAGRLRLLPGLEFGASEGLHLLAIGDRDSILVYRDRLRHLLERSGSCSTREFLHSQEGLEIISIVAHPFRKKRHILRVDPALYRRFDAIGLNARDLYFRGAEIRKLTEVLSLAHQVPVVAGSDSHHYFQLGAVHNHFQRAFDSISDLKLLIAQGAYTIHTDQGLNHKVAAARKAKKRLRRETTSACPTVMAGI
jgi:hypothetical protein